MQSFEHKDYWKPARRPSQSRVEDSYFRCKIQILLHGIFAMHADHAEGGIS